MAENVGGRCVEIAEKEQFTCKKGKWSNLDGLKDKNNATLCLTNSQLPGIIHAREVCDAKMGEDC